MISDYCRGNQEHSQRFLDYVASRDYKLYTVKEYGNILEKAGFKNVRTYTYLNLSKFDFQGCCHGQDCFDD